MLPLYGRNSTSFNIYTRFYLTASPSQTRVMEFIYFTTAIFTEICRFIVAAKGTPLYNCFDFYQRLDYQP